MLACTQGHLSVVKILVEHGADMAALDEEGHSPMHLVFLRLHIDNITSSHPGRNDQVCVSEI